MHHEGIFSYYHQREEFLSDMLLNTQWLIQPFTPLINQKWFALGQCCEKAVYEFSRNNCKRSCRYDQLKQVCLNHCTIYVISAFIGQLTCWLAVLHGKNLSTGHYAQNLQFFFIPAMLILGAIDFGPLSVILTLTGDHNFST